MSKHKHIVISGEYAGVGKSYASQLFSSKALVVTPYHTLCQELITEGYQVITWSNELKNDKG